MGEGEAEEEGAGEEEEGGSAKPNRHEQTIRYDGSL